MALPTTVESSRFLAMALAAVCWMVAIPSRAQAPANSARTQSATTRAADDKRSDGSGETVGSATNDTAQPSAVDTLGSEAALSRSLALYDGGQYEECVVGLEDWLKTVREASPGHLQQVDQARIYLGACLIASGHTEKADQAFREAIRNNPQMRAPDSLVFPQTVVDRFLHVREQLLTDIRSEERSRIQEAESHAKEQGAKRTRELQVQAKLRAMAQEQTIVEKNRRWLASVPFGVGQFQNGDNATGGVFLAAEVALAGTCITALVIDEHLANKSREPGIDLVELRAKRLDAYRVIVASSWGFLGVAAGGIIHAHWRFVPERVTKRKRLLPPELEQAVDGEPQRQRLSREAAPSSPSIGVTLLPSLGFVGTF